MNKFRTLLLTLIGVLSGAALTADALRRKIVHSAQGFAGDFERARLQDRLPSKRVESYPASGRKGGVATEAKAEKENGTPTELSQDSNFAIASNSEPEPNETEDKTPAPKPPLGESDFTGRYKHNTNLEKVHGLLGYLQELIKRFSGDYCSAWAAALSFFAILSIPPVLLCGLAVLGYVIHNPAEATARVQELLARVLPGNLDTTTKQAADLIHQLNIEESVTTLREARGAAGIIGVLSLFWAALQIFVNASIPMNAAFRTRETRGWIKLRLIALGLLVGAGMLFLLALIPSSGAEIINALHIPGIGTLPESLPPMLATLFTLTLAAIGIAINALMFTLIYRYLPSPSAQVTWRAAGMAGAIVAVLWEIAKQAFAFYLHRFANYNKVYGSLGGLIGLIFWIYYTSMILLLGAEIAKLYLDARAVKQGAQQRG